MHRDHAVSISFGQKKYAESSGADADGILQHGLEYWLQTTGRRTDDAQHIRSGRLLFQRLTKIGRALTQFAEQPRVLDGDDSLGGEVLQQRNLLFAKGTDFLTIAGDDAN